MPLLQHPLAGGPCSAGLFRAPAFGQRQAALSWLAASGLAEAIRGGLASAVPPPAMAGWLAQLREARVGGTPGLPDPGPAALGCARGAAVVLLDPCAPGLAEAA